MQARTRRPNGSCIRCSGETSMRRCASSGEFRATWIGRCSCTRTVCFSSDGFSPGMHTKAFLSCCASTASRPWRARALSTFSQTALREFEGSRRSRSNGPRLSNLATTSGSRTNEFGDSSQRRRHSRGASRSPARMRVRGIRFALRGSDSGIAQALSPPLRAVSHCVQLRPVFDAISRWDFGPGACAVERSRLHSKPPDKTQDSSRFSSRLPCLSSEYPAGSGLCYSQPFRLPSSCCKAAPRPGSRRPPGPPSHSSPLRSSRAKV